jgi:hypothetical protein
LCECIQHLAGSFSPSNALCVVRKRCDTKTTPNALLAMTSSSRNVSGWMPPENAVGDHVGQRDVDGSGDRPSQPPHRLVADPRLRAERGRRADDGARCGDHHLENLAKAIASAIPRR